jgi:iron(III) transport system ATP-binding protein
MTALEISGLCVTLNERLILDHLDLNIDSGSFTAVLGPSGCGKTTLLRSIAGLITPTAGAIRFGKQLVSVSSLVLPPHRRNIGYVPQEGALFPHLNVADNVAFGLKRKEKDKYERADIVEQMLEFVGLPGFQKRMPFQLSGGQQTRVALARALAINPSMVLLDEPFAALDHVLREEISAEVASMLKSRAITTIMVTHDREEALVTADHIALMRTGQVVQFGTPNEVYQSPRNAEVAQSTGDALVLPGIKQDDGAIAFALSHLPVINVEGERGSLLVRPEEIKVERGGQDGTPATIEKIYYYGHDAMLDLVLSDGSHLRARVPGPVDFAVGEAVSLRHVGPLRFFN